MKIKAIDAECRDGMVTAELAYITSCKQPGQLTDVEINPVTSSVSVTSAIASADTGQVTVPVSMPAQRRVALR